MKKEWLIAGIIGCIIFIIIGIISCYNAAKENNKPYELPIYISQKFTITKNGNGWEIDGKLTNLLNEEINIDELHFKISGKDPDKYKTYYESTITEKNILIGIKETYYFNDTYYTVGKTDFSTVILDYCIINGEQIKPVYSSDGIHFNQSSPNYFWFVFGLVFLIAGLIFAFKN